MNEKALLSSFECPNKLKKKNDNNNNNNNNNNHGAS